MIYNREATVEQMAADIPRDENISDEALDRARDSAMICNGRCAYTLNLESD